MVTRVDVVVVGGGLGGLAAAALVAKQGQKAVVLERASGLGGRAATTVRDGFHLNLGGHALYRGGPAERVLRSLGVTYEGKAPRTSGGVVVVNGERHVLPTGLGTLLKTALLDARGKLEFARLLATLPGLDLRPLETVSLATWLDETVKDRHVQRTIETLVRLSTYAHAPERLSAGAGLRQLQVASKHGVIYVDGGWQTLVDGLAKALAALGVRTVNGGIVEEVAPDGSGWRVRQATGKTWEARSVILAVGPRAARAMVLGPLRSTLEAWADDALPARAACLDVGLRALPDPKTTFALGLDAPLYFSVHSHAAKLAPDGHALVQVMKYLAPDDAGTADDHARDLDEWLDLCQPGWRDQVLVRRYLPDMIASNDIVRANAGGASGRPGPSVPRAEGLFVVGDWVGGTGHRR